MFEREKQLVLARKDNSRKGSIDGRILSLVNTFNGKPEYYTTSSCSGRIMLLVPGATKKETCWTFVSHEPITLGQLRQGMKRLPTADVWLRQEAMILHVCCKTLNDANKLLQWSKDCGFKRAGIISLRPRIIMEIISSSHFETIIASKGKLLLDDYALQLLIAEANKRLKRNFSQIEKFEDEIKEKGN